MFLSYMDIFLKTKVMFFSPLYFFYEPPVTRIDIYTSWIGKAQ